MKVFVLFLLLVNTALAQDIKPVSFKDYMKSPSNIVLDAAVIASRFGDYSTTEECARIRVKGNALVHHGGYCYETYLPQSMADSKWQMGVFSGAAAFASIYGHYQLVKHHHKRLADTMQLVHIAIVGKFVVNNYYLNVEAIEHVDRYPIPKTTERE